ncbi:hypothetical protein Mapa_004931 [Marchantia paleacea]|nr:hypothetical protein Mapa_004931 [Marchantia paleacea]
MSYTIRVRVIQTKPSAWYSIVEKTNWLYGGTWSEVDGEQFLNMDASGTSGMLRFRNPAGEFFLVALGVHNYKRWCDIVVDQKSTNTSVEILPTYYDNGSRNEMLWKQLASLEKKTSKGEHIKVDYYKEDGNTLYATITIT